MDTTLRNVTIETLGSALSASVVIGASSLTVDDAADFSEDGGQLLLGDLTYAFASCDPDTGLITLETGVTLTVAADAGDAVDVVTAPGTVAEQWTAHVEWGDGDELDTAVIPTTLIPYFTEGDEQTGAVVSIQDDGRGGNIVTSRPGEAAVFDGAYLDETTVPDRVPTAAPTEVLTLTVVGDKLGLTALAQGDPIDATTLLDWYIDGVLKESNRSPVYRFTTDSVGAAFTPDTDYAITVQPSNVVGPGTMSPAVNGRLDPVVDEVFIRAVVAAGIVMAKVFRSGNITIEPDVITVPRAGGATTYIRADDQPNKFTGGAELDWATIIGSLVLQGLTTVYGGVELASGTGTPAAAPASSNDWSAHYTQSNLSMVGTVFRGLYDNGTTWVTTVKGPSGNDIVSINKTTGAYTVLTSIFSTSFPFGGVTKVGTDWYVLTYTDFGGGTWYVIKYNSSWVFQTSWEWAYNDTGGWDPAIGSDGTSIFIARMASPAAGGTVDRLIVRKFSTAGVLVGAATTVTAINEGKGTVTGIYIGSADFGAARYVVNTPGRVVVVDTAGARQSAQEWDIAAGEDMLGLSWDGSQFHSLGGSGKVWHYSPLVSNTMRSSKHTKFNSVSGFETAASPVSAFIQRARQWLRLEAPAPGGDANSVRFYIGAHRQPDLGAGVYAAVYGLPGTAGVDSGASTFTGLASPGEFKTGKTDVEGPIVDIHGDGPGRMGDLTWDSNGKITRWPAIPRARAGATADVTLTTATLTTLALNTEVAPGYDTASLHSTSTNNSRILLNKVGVWTVTARVGFAANATGRRLVLIYRNGVEVARSVAFPNASTIAAVSVTEAVESSAVTDYVEVVAYQDSGGNLTTAHDYVSLSVAYLGQ